MAFNVILSANFSKRSNSTKQPTGGTTFSGVLKEPCSILEPTILIESSSATFQSFNYAHIPIFQRYYNITDIVSINGLWEVHMRSDPLATYKTQIGSIIAYVERAAADFDGDIQDTLYPAKSVANIIHPDITSSYHTVAPAGGTYVLGVFTKEPGLGHGGAVTYYAMGETELNNLMNYLLSSQFLDDAGFDYVEGTQVPLPYPENGVTQELARCIVKPIDYIASCMWFPIDSLSGTPGTLTLGYWDFGENTFSAKKLETLVYTENVIATIPQHPQNVAGSNPRGNYLNYAPYTSATLYIPPFGSIPLDMSYRENGSFGGAVHATIYVDTITGKATARVTLDGNECAEASAMFGTPIQISQITPDVLGGLSDLGGSLMSLSLGQMGGFMHTVGNAIKEFTPSPRSTGVNGSFLTEVVPPKLVVRRAMLVDENNTEMGRPLCQNRTIDTLSGYIKCGEATDNLPGFESEKTEIQKALLNGFFWE